MGSTIVAMVYRKDTQHRKKIKKCKEYNKAWTAGKYFVFSLYVCTNNKFNNEVQQGKGTHSAPRIGQS